VRHNQQQQQPEDADGQSEHSFLPVIIAAQLQHFRWRRRRRGRQQRRGRRGAAEQD